MCMVLRPSLSWCFRQPLRVVSELHHVILELELMVLQGHLWGERQELPFWAGG